MLKFCKDEVRLVDEVVEVLEWELQRKEDGFIHLYRDMFPVIINNKELILIEEEMENFDKDLFLTFRPITNGRHVSLLMDFMYDNEDDFLDSIVTGKLEQGKYFCKLVDFDGEIVREVVAETETAAKFKIFYDYYLEQNCDKEINKIRRYEEKLKLRKEQQKQERLNKNTKKIAKNK